MRGRYILPWSTLARNFNTTSKDFNAVKDPAKLFFNPDVQARLKTLTGRDENRIFNPKKLGKRLSSPKYEFMTKTQLEEALKDSQKKMDIKLQMPPLLSARQEINEIITADPELKGLDDSKFVFTDISLGIPERKRMVVVRDSEGTLRKATWEERERMLQIYFPRPGREILPPPMFNEDNLKRLLEKKSYIFILDRACAQFEPDDPQYIRVTRDTYSHIEKHEDFDLLWSTRHYGPMVLHLTIEKRIDSLIKTLLMNLKREDVADLIQLYNFVHHGSSLTTTVEDDMALLKEYIEQDSLKRHQLELALQSYQEYLKQNQEIEKSRVSA